MIVCDYLEVPVENTKVGPFLIIKKLGTNRRQRVYHARQTEQQRDVALKFIVPHLTRDPDARARFLREAQAAAAVKSVNPAPMLSVKNNPPHRAGASFFNPGMTF